MGVGVCIRKRLRAFRPCRLCRIPLELVCHKSFLRRVFQIVDLVLSAPFHAPEETLHVQLTKPDVLQTLRNQVVLEKMPSVVSGVQRQEIADHRIPDACVAEVYLLGLLQLVSQIPRERRQSKHHERLFKPLDVRCHGFIVHADQIPDLLV